MSNLIIDAKTARELSIGSVAGVDTSGHEIINVFKAIAEAGNNRRFHVVHQLNNEATARSIYAVLKELGYTCDVVYSVKDAGSHLQLSNISLLIYWF